MITRRLALAGGLGFALGARSGPALAETKSIRIGVQFGLTYLPAVVAISEGMIAKRAAEFGVPDLKVEMLRFSGSAAMNEALLSNSVDLGTLGTAGALIAWDKTRGRQHIKSLAAIAATSYTLYTNKPGLKSLADFKTEDKIAVPASNSPQALLLRMAAEKGLADKTRIDSLLVSLPHPDATAAILGGQAVAGYFATPPFSQVLARSDKVRPILTSREILGGSEATSITLACNQGFVDDNPKVARAALAGFEDAIALIARDPKQAAAIYLKSEKVSLPPAEIESIVSDGSTVYSVAPQGLMTYARAMLQQGQLRKLPEGWKDVFFPLIGERQGS